MITGKFFWAERVRNPRWGKAGMVRIYKAKDTVWHNYTAIECGKQFRQVTGLTLEFGIRYKIRMFATEK